MLTQTVESQALDVRSILSPKVFTHIVTLIHRGTGREEVLTVETLSDRFVDVLREVSHQKAIRGLFGYEVFEAIDCNDPF